MMANDVEQYAVLFHNRAREIFFSLCRRFKSSIAAIDRQRDENVFQQLQAQYNSELKSQLQAVVSELLERLPRNSNRNDYNRVLSSFIEEYSNEFVQKARSL